jgi:hypothetical protein
MKRTRVFNYVIWGSVCEWPVVVDLSRDERRGSWTIYFRYVDPEARHAETVTATEASEIYESLVENNSSVVDFADSIERVASGLPVQTHRENLVALAAELRSLPRAETDGSSEQVARRRLTLRSTRPPSAAAELKR